MSCRYSQGLDLYLAGSLVDFSIIQREGSFSIESLQAADAVANSRDKCREFRFFEKFVKYVSTQWG
jgi:hypothetical protein